MYLWVCDLLCYVPLYWEALDNGFNNMEGFVSFDVSSYDIIDIEYKFASLQGNIY